MRIRLVRLARLMASLALADELARGLRCYRPRAKPSASAAAKSPAGVMPPAATSFALVDIGANMLDPMFQEGK